MTVNQDFTREHIRSLRDQSIELVVKATLALEDQCDLTHKQGADIVAPILTRLATDAMEKALEFMTTLMKEQRR